MIRITKNRRGFTLVEMILSLAIIGIIFGLTTALVVCVRRASLVSYNLNDSSDYGVLYGSGFENSLLSHTQNRVAGTWTITNNLLTCNGVPVFTPQQLTTARANGDVVNKWNIRMCFREYKGLVYYAVHITDNYYNPGQQIFYYDTSVWIPHFTSANGTISLSGNQSGSAGSYYYDVITYTPA